MKITLLFQNLNQWHSLHEKEHTSIEKQLQQITRFFIALHSPLLVLVVPVEEEVQLDEVGEEQSELPDELDPVEPTPEPPLSFLLFPNIDSSTSPSMPSQFSALWMEIKSCVWSKCSKKSPAMPTKPILEKCEAYLDKLVVCLANDSSFALGGTEHHVIVQGVIHHRKTWNYVSPIQTKFIHFW